MPVFVKTLKYNHLVRTTTALSRDKFTKTFSSFIPSQLKSITSVIKRLHKMSYYTSSPFISDTNKSRKLKNAIMLL